jgi:hypothetical protein
MIVIRMIVASALMMVTFSIIAYLMTGYLHIQMWRLGVSSLQIEGAPVHYGEGVINILFKASSPPPLLLGRAFTRSI